MKAGVVSINRLPVEVTGDVPVKVIRNLPRTTDYGMEIGEYLHVGIGWPSGLVMDIWGEPADVEAVLRKALAAVEVAMGKEVAA